MNAYDNANRQYRQNPDGSWSHKLGSDPVTNVDADDEIIWNPKDANRRYDGANYSTFIDYYAVSPLNLMYDHTEAD